MWHRVGNNIERTCIFLFGQAGCRNKRRLVTGLLLLCGLSLLGSCSEMVLLDPKGPIGETERNVIITAFILMLIVVIPVLIMTIWFPWKYRHGNDKAVYTPKWNFSWKIEIVVWLVPAIIVTSLGVLVYHTTFRLDPARPVDPSIKPLSIEAVSLDWKWLFIYPDDNIAVVNELVFPAGVPLSFRITSDTVMTSFFIPQLGSQIYAMAGMQTRLNLLAREPGTYTGQNQQFSGYGYADMNFKAHAVSKEQYADWLTKVKGTSETLDPARYRELAKPTSGYHPVTRFSSVEPGLFDTILHKYQSMHSVNSGAMPMNPSDTKGE